MTSNVHHPNERCIDLFKKLSTYIDQELDHSTYRQIESHLKHCPPCHACLETLKRTSKLCKDLRGVPVPKALSQKLKKIVHEISF